jgi:hypothetical protein
MPLAVKLQPSLNISDIASLSEYLVFLGREGYFRMMPSGLLGIIRLELSALSAQ